MNVPVDPAANSSKQPSLKVSRRPSFWLHGASRNASSPDVTTGFGLTRGVPRIVFRPSCSFIEVFGLARRCFGCVVTQGDLTFQAKPSHRNAQIRTNSGRARTRRGGDEALSMLAYNLGNLWRRLAQPKGIENWSLTSLQQRLVNTGRRLVKHARYYWLMLAEGHLNRRRFRTVLGCIARFASALGIVQG